MSSPQPESFTRKYAFVAFKLVVSVALLALVFSRIDLGELWATARTASVAWLVVALGVYAVNVAASVWRWHLLLTAQGVGFGFRTEFASYLVSLFFNNFLPSNIGGDVIRIRDSAREAGSMTLAATIVLVDRVLGLMGLVLVAACGTSFAMQGVARGALPIPPAWLWGAFLAGAFVMTPAVLMPDGVGRLLRPLTILHPEWVGDRIARVTSVLARFRERPGPLVACFFAAVFVQALTVVFYVATAHALRIPIGAWDLAVIVPLSIVVQMAPVSINGFGVREATFSLYFVRLGLPIESAVLLSLVATALVIIFSSSGAAVYIARTHPRHKRELIVNK